MADNHRKDGSEKDAAKIASSEADQVERSGTASVIRIGGDFASSVVACGAIGWFVDRQFDTQPLFLLVMVFFGFGSGIARIWYALNGKKAAPETDKSDGEEG